MRAERSLGGGRQPEPGPSGSIGSGRIGQQVGRDHPLPVTGERGRESPLGVGLQQEDVVIPGKTQKPGRGAEDPVRRGAPGAGLAHGDA